MALKTGRNGIVPNPLCIQIYLLFQSHFIYKNIIKYISYILLSPVLLFTFLKLTHPNYDKPKQKMTIEAAVNWPVFMSHGRDDKAKSRGKKKFCYQLLIYKSQKPLGERPWVICHSVAKSCLTLCDLMDCSMPGPSVLHCLSEFAQIHVHWVGDAI